MDSDNEYMGVFQAKTVLSLLFFAFLPGDIASWGKPQRRGQSPPKRQRIFVMTSPELKEDFCWINQNRNDR